MMGACLSKISPYKKNETKEHKESTKEESVPEKEALKEKEKEEDYSSYLEIEDAIHPRDTVTPEVDSIRPAALFSAQAGSLFGESSKFLRKSKDYSSKGNYLYAKVTKFEYQLPDNETLLSAKYSLPIIAKSIIGNESSVKIVHKINHGEEINQTYRYEFADKFMNAFDEIELDRSIPLTIELNGVKHHLDISSASLTHLPQLGCNVNDKRYQTYNKYSNIMIEKSIEIPANFSVQIEAYQEKLQNVMIPFSANMVIFRRKGKEQYSSESIKKYLKKLNLTIVSADDHSITTQVSGNLSASFGLENVFNVNTI